MPSSSATPAPLPNPVPLAVTTLQAAHLPERVMTAVTLMNDAERELGRLRPLSSVEDWQDREHALALFAQADKVVSTYPVRKFGLAMVGVR